MDKTHLINRKSRVPLHSPKREEQHDQGVSVQGPCKSKSAFHVQGDRLEAPLVAVRLPAGGRASARFANRKANGIVKRKQFLKYTKPLLFVRGTYTHIQGVSGSAGAAKSDTSDNQQSASSLPGLEHAALIWFPLNTTKGILKTPPKSSCAEPVTPGTKRLR